MAEKFYSLLTNIGKAKIANSVGLGTKINFATMKVGDGGGAYYEPTEDQTDLKNVVWQGNINHVAIDEDNPSWINIEVMIPSDVGGFTIREYGAFDEVGNMLGICKCAESYKPVIADGSTKELLLNLILSVSNTDSVNLKIDPTIIFAKKSEVEQLRSDINTSLSDMVYQVAGGTATALTLTTQTLVNGYAKTFIASGNNNGAATTINGKPLYKPGTTTAPNLISGKAYTVWYNAAGSCFFIKASAEGDAITSNVLAGKKFSNDNDTGLVGTLDLSNLISANIKNGVTINGVTGKASVVDTSDALATATQILAGASAYVGGSKINGTLPIRGDEEYSGWRRASLGTVAAIEGRAHFCIPDGAYFGTANNGMQGIFVDDSNFSAANIVSGKSVLGLNGSATIESLGGKRFATGTVTASGLPNFVYTNGQTATGLSSVTVSGLSFKASHILLKSTNGLYETSYDELSDTNYAKSVKVSQYNAASLSSYSYNIKGDVSPASVTNGGFTLPAINATYNWIAYE